MRIFNNPDLYPTPENVIQQMIGGLDLKGKTVLEPSAGLGDIVDFCAGSGASVLACEIVPELRDLLSQKDCRIIGEDFLNVQSDEISHIDFIIMNPPFSADEKSLSLPVFQNAERETAVEIGLIRIFKPKTGSDNDFSEYFSDEADDDEGQFNGLIKHSYVREIVQRYVSAVKQYDVIVDKSVELNQTISAIHSVARFPERRNV